MARRNSSIQHIDFMVPFRGIERDGTMQPQQNTLLETDLLKTFVTISETGNFTVAAKRVFRTPSAVSMQIKRLEDLLGRALFIRHPRHVTLTSDGEAFLVHAKDILRINDEALSRFRVPQLEGRIRFGVPDDFGVRYLPEILSRFASTHPLVEVEVLLSTSVILTRKFEAGEIDMILTVSAQSDPAPGQLVHSEPLVWVGARDGIAFSRTPTPLAMSTYGCPWRAAALAALDRSGHPYRIAYTSETGAGQLAAVMADLAIAPLPISLLGEQHRKLTEKDGFGEIGSYQLRLQKIPDIGSAGQAFGDHVCESFGQAE
ncbi:LysR substrate-binding domain-containing protein [Paenirhodobacter populi]|nr:LysR substrate-binding domain-containing protein [Sinirhodobacter populi]